MGGKDFIKVCTVIEWIYIEKIIGSKIIPVGLLESDSV
jgi:hypothetical protein